MDPGKNPQEGGSGPKVARSMRGGGNPQDMQTQSTLARARLSMLKSRGVRSTRLESRSRSRTPSPSMAPVDTRKAEQRDQPPSIRSQSTTDSKTRPTAPSRRVSKQTSESVRKSMPSLPPEEAPAEPKPEKSAGKLTLPVEDAGKRTHQDEEKGASMASSRRSMKKVKLSKMSRFTSLRTYLQRQDSVKRQIAAHRAADGGGELGTGYDEELEEEEASICATFKVPIIITLVVVIITVVVIVIIFLTSRSRSDESSHGTVKAVLLHHL